MFVGRQRELNELARLYNTDKFQCAIIYGRRRVGKTALIAEFIKDKESIYFTGQETNAKENLENLSQSIFALARDFSAASPVFASYKDALEAVFELAKTRRVALAIDEYPYLAASYQAISSLLQTYIDKYKETSKLFIILCGSSLSFMENQILGYKSPLYGRRTAQFKILPFDYTQARDYFGDSFNDIDTAVLYGVTGGVPLYMSLIDRNLSVADNIKLNFLTPSGYLFEEPGNLIKQECREPARYNTIIKAIANGASRLSEIAGKVGLETALCSTYIAKLISIGIIKKEYPFREETSKKTVYRLEDNMFRFWYRFVPDNMSLIQRGETGLSYERIESQISGFMGAVFEEICKQYLWRQNVAKRAPILFTDAGRWWGNNPKKREECEIDIIADDKESGIFCECKWTNDAVGSGVLRTLIERSALFPHKKKYYYVFAKTGFTDGIQAEAAGRGNVALIRFEDF
ncbi:MAG: ATP-binding protein [Peptococcaceae bacterium]|jgi:AAA+ ATPase superfamily predicted ATPase|nr:ATP-binding protein [Peptococcaceae bacterium]